jgi:GMP synthase-like glutamine amidotransferase
VRVLTIVHQRDAGAGVFGDAAAAAGHELVQWLPPEQPPPELDGVGAAMVFGGAMHADQEEAHPWLVPEKALLRELLDRGTPILGVCLGSQLLAEAAGGRPRRAPEPEIGWYDVELTEAGAGDDLLRDLPPRFESFQWHSYESTLPPGATALANSAVCLQAYRLDGRAWGIQFHAEVTGAQVSSWLDDYRTDEDAVRIGLDPEGVRAQTAPRIEAWNELGRGVCERFLLVATRA